MNHAPMTVELAVLKAIGGGGLTPEDCKALSPQNAAEVSRRLIEIAREQRSGKAVR